MNGKLMTDGWAGRRVYRVKIIGETPKRDRVLLLEQARLPGRNRLTAAGSVVFVPKSAVKRESDV